ncbi:MAG: ABC transporter ATP-binding protein [Proteobacteria bacterium]|nr:ABC transporter ATP-binding protein [Pseudomonadota bacterium]
MITETYRLLKDLGNLIPATQRKGILPCILVMTGLGFLEIVSAALIVTLATRIAEGTPDRSILFFAVACLFVFTAKGGMAILDSFLQNRWVQNLILDLKERLIKRYVNMNYSLQTQRNSAQSLAILYNDADIYMRIGLASLGILLTEAVIFAVLMGFLLYVQPGVTCFLLVMFAALGFLFIVKLLPVFKYWGKMTHETAQQGYREALQILQSGRDITIFGKSPYFIGRYLEQSRLRAQIIIKSAVAQVIPRTSIEIAFIAFFVSLVFYFYTTAADFSALTKALSAYLYAGLRLLPGLNRVMIQLNNIKMCETSMRRVVDEINSPFFETAYISSPSLRFQNAIRVENVTHRYAGAARDALNNVTLEIKKGEFTGIIGETGTGKSTLLYLILGLLNPKEGKVTIDGQYPANSYEWHEKIGYTAQDFSLIDGTVADNIAFGVPPEEREDTLIDEAVRDSQLEQFIRNLPNGVETRIGEDGALISGGEKQRIALARALYRKPEILVLDEATSALDLTTEASIMGAVRSLKKKNMTIIAVTHRPQTLENADRIIEIANGKITDKKGKEGRKDVA